MAPGSPAAGSAAAGGVAGLGPFVLARAPSPPTPLLSRGGGGGGGGSSRPKRLSSAPGAGGGGERASRGEWGAMAKLRVAYEYTEAEDKSIRLGLFLIISGVVSLFIFGFCWLSPALQDLQATAANCTVLSVQQIGEVFECTFTCGTDCRGTSQYPCVQVYVNNSESNSRALLHSDQHQLLTNPKVRTRELPSNGCGFEASVGDRPQGKIWSVLSLHLWSCRAPVLGVCLPAGRWYPESLCKH